MSDETAKWASPRGHAIASHETDKLPEMPAEFYSNLVNYGKAIMKDGKCIDPRDVYILEDDKLPAVSGMGVTVDSADDARQRALEYMTDPMFPIYMQHGSREFALIPAEFVDAIILALTQPAPVEKE